jgi:hypothetical protein
MKELSELGTEWAVILATALTIFGNKVVMPWLKKILVDDNEIFLFKSKNSSLIRDQYLYGLLEYFKAQRSILIEFSNGESSISGFSFMYWGITHEKTDEEKAIKLAPYFKKELVAQYPISIGGLEHELRYKIYHDDDVHLPNEVRAMMHDYGIKSVIMFRLHKTHLMYGTVSLHWQTDYFRNDEHGEFRARELSDDEYDKFSAQCKKILKARQTPKFFEVFKFKK